MTSDRNSSGCWMELHDSDVLAITAIGDDVELRLDAYVHRWEGTAEGRRGSGWTQPVRMLVLDARPPTLQSRLPVAISEGWFAGGTAHGNLVPVPLVATEPVRLHVVLVTADVFDLVGSGVQIHAAGPAVYVEDLPADLDPER